MSRPYRTVGALETAPAPEPGTDHAVGSSAPAPALGPIRLVLVRGVEYRLIFDDESGAWLIQTRL